MKLLGLHISAQEGVDIIYSCRSIKLERSTGVFPQGGVRILLRKRGPGPCFWDSDGHHIHHLGSLETATRADGGMACGSNNLPAHFFTTALKFLRQSGGGAMKMYPSDFSEKPADTKLCLPTRRSKKRSTGDYFLFSFHESSEANCSLVFPTVSIPSFWQATTNGSETCCVATTGV